MACSNKTKNSSIFFKNRSVGNVVSFESAISAISGEYLETLSSDMQNFPLSFYCLGIYG